MTQSASILIVDDEPIGRETLGEMLMLEGYALIYAADGLEAIKTVAEQSIDLILLDVMMPGMNGFQVCQHLKGDESQRHIPIILVTALDSKSDLAKGLDAGADDFLSKPVNTLELRARVRSLLRVKKQYDELQDALNLREDMANMIVHDMRSPLTAILGISELAQHDVDSKEQIIADLKLIYGNAKRLNAFINDLLNMAKMREGKLILNRSMTDLKKQIDLVISSHTVTAQLKNINFVVDFLTSDLHKVYLDATLFQRVLDNLISNAIKYSNQNSTVTVQVATFSPQESTPEQDTDDSTPQKANLRLNVIDEGIGILEQNRQKIFEKFSTLPNTGGHIQQVGLGLAFCKMVVEAHNGQVFITSNKPHGTIITVEI